jgi:hypothetical protein
MRFVLAETSTASTLISNTFRQGRALQHCNRLPYHLADDDAVRFDGDLSRLASGALQQVRDHSPELIRAAKHGFPRLALFWKQGARSPSSISETRRGVA